MKVCVVVAYFGRWPRLFSVFLESCRRNPRLDVLIFTDIEPSGSAPENVRFVSSSLAEVRARLSARLGFEAALDDPYKLCDVKPAFGELFEEHLREYEFWGHSDIDLAYGDLSPILDPSFLARFDVISCREEWLWGPFCLYRNTPEINRLYRTSPDCEKVFRSSRHMAYDESSFRWKEMIETSIFDIDFPYENMTLIVKRAAREGRLRAYFATHEVVGPFHRDAQVMYDDGRVVYDGREHLFLHWGTHSRADRLTLPDWRRCPKRFYMTPHHFYTQPQRESRLFPLAENLREIRYRCARLSRLLWRAARWRSPGWGARA